MREQYAAPGKLCRSSAVLKMHCEGRCRFLFSTASTIHDLSHGAPSFNANALRQVHALFFGCCCFCIAAACYAQQPPSVLHTYFLFTAHTHSCNAHVGFQ